MNQPLVACIILNYNEWKVTQDCIKSLESSIYKNFKIILIDNNSSTDPSHISYKNQQLPLFDNQYSNKSFKNEIVFKNDIYSIKSTKNGGFPFGINLGIHVSREIINSDFIWILNNDTICDESTLEHLVNKSNPLSIVGSTLIDQNNKKLRSIGTINKFIGTSYMAKKNSSRNYIPFTSALISKKTVELIGPLNEDYFLYYDDADYCFAAVKQNVKLIHAEKSLVMHNESYTASKPENNQVCPDWIPLYSKKIFMKKYKFPKISILISLTLSFLKRLLLCKFKNSLDVIILMMNEKKLLNQHHYYKK